jgi:hypothetical protein
MSASAPTIEVGGEIEEFPTEVGLLAPKFAHHDGS